MLAFVFGLAAVFQLKHFHVNVAISHQLGTFICHAFFTYPIIKQRPPFCTTEILHWDHQITHFGISLLLMLNGLGSQNTLFRKRILHLMALSWWCLFNS